MGSSFVASTTEKRENAEIAVVAAYADTADSGTAARSAVAVAYANTTK